MWINPKYADPYPASPAAPQDDGEPLGTFQRSEGREELRVVLKTYQGHPYVSIRVWERDQAGQLWPVKGKGVSVRISEAAGVAAAMRSVGTNVVDTDGNGSDQRSAGSSRPAQRRGRPHPKRDGGGEAEITDRVETSPEFHEFD